MISAKLISVRVNLEHGVHTSDEVKRKKNQVDGRKVEETKFKDVVHMSLITDNFTVIFGNLCQVCLSLYEIEYRTLNANLVQFFFVPS